MEYNDLKLRPSRSEPPTFPNEGPQTNVIDVWDVDGTTPLPMTVDTPRTGPKLLAATVLLAVVGITGYFVFQSQSSTQPAATAAQAAASVAQDAPSPLGADAPAINLPPLEETDEVVRELVKQLSSNPTIAAWLATDDLIRNFTVVVANIAAGQPTVKQMPALKPAGAFQVEDRGEDLFVSTRTYARYAPLATAATSVDAAGAAKLYTTLKPRIEDAYRELGTADTFDATLEKAIVLLLKTPVPDGRIPLQPDGAVSYRFADRRFETLTPTQKLLVRSGPENQRAIQTSLRNIALALGIPAERLP